MIPFLAPESRERRSNPLQSVWFYSLFKGEKKNEEEKNKQTTTQGKQQTNCTWHLIQKILHWVEKLSCFPRLQPRLLMRASDWLSTDHVSVQCPSLCLIKNLLCRHCFFLCLFWHLPSTPPTLENKTGQPPGAGCCSDLPARHPRI